MKNPYEYKSGKYLDITLSGEATRLHRKNTHIFTHTHQPEGDHIYIMHRPLPDDSVEATYVWRKRFMESNDPERFDRIALRIGQIGCEHHKADFMSDYDLEHFNRIFGRHPEVVSPTLELTERHERLIANLGATLREMPTRDIITDLSFPNDFRPYPSMWR